jgi:hypothetical protein
MHSGAYGTCALQESLRQMRGTASPRSPAPSHGVGGMFAASTIIMAKSRVYLFDRPVMAESAKRGGAR